LMPHKAKGPPRGGVSADGPNVCVCLAANSDEIAPLTAPRQREISRTPRAVSGSVVSFAARHCRRSPAPPRYDVRITVSSVRRPIGRTRAFRLADCDLDELIATAQRLEGEA
jgi:hypothetical protein